MAWAWVLEGGGGPISAGDYGSIQAALEAHPGKAVYLPAGDYFIDETVVIRTEGAGLYGHGRILQRNPAADILRIEGAARVTVEGITLERVAPEFFRSAMGIRAVQSPFLALRNVRVWKNRAEMTAVLVDRCDYATIEGCEVVDFKTVAIDNRMDNALYRYAFRCLNGHGLMVQASKGARIVRNRVIETELLPTREMMERHDLGKIVERAEELGELASYGVDAEGFVFIWHQGGGILVRPATTAAHILVDGNYIENAAQGMDLHGDFLIVTNNHVINGYMGMKAFHGARGVVIANNIFQAPGKYGILLRPGSESWEAGAEKFGERQVEPNAERGILIANNQILDMGYGPEHWRLWNADPSETSPVGIKIGTGPLAENPRLSEVILAHNIVYDRGRDGVLKDGVVVVEPPRYKWAIVFDTEWMPRNVVLDGNIFHPGELGVSNLPGVD